MIQTSAKITATRPFVLTAPQALRGRGQSSECRTPSGSDDFGVRRQQHELVTRPQQHKDKDVVDRRVSTLLLRIATWRIAMAVLHLSSSPFHTQACQYFHLPGFTPCPILSAGPSLSLHTSAHALPFPYIRACIPWDPSPGFAGSGSAALRGPAPGVSCGLTAEPLRLLCCGSRGDSGILPTCRGRPGGLRVGIVPLPGTAWLGAIARSGRLLAGLKGLSIWGWWGVHSLRHRRCKSAILLGLLFHAPEPVPLHHASVVSRDMGCPMPL